MNKNIEDKIEALVQEGEASLSELWDTAKEAFTNPATPAEAKDPLTDLAPGAMPQTEIPLEPQKLTPHEMDPGKFPKSPMEILKKSQQ